ncbi:hypothetical protein DFS33DRAFT_1375312 [Desarmillaria ectypa]|nr:hypothetical protein DFS33DRAFT_1375312 [Desarmillaria ectypa]
MDDVIFSSSNIKYIAREMWCTDQAQKTLTAAIKEDHEEARWSWQLTWEIAHHAVGEEIVVYPLMEKHPGDKGLKLADEDRNDHQMLNDLEHLEPGSQDHQTQLKEIVDHLHQHDDNEETKDLPLLEPVLGVKNSKKTAYSFQTIKNLVSTHAHPFAPNKLPYKTFLGFLAMPIDKLKVIFSAFPTDEMKEREQE